MNKLLEIFVKNRAEEFKSKCEQNGVSYEKIDAITAALSGKEYSCLVIDYKTTITEWREDIKPPVALRIIKTDNDFIFIKDKKYVHLIR